MPTRLLLPAALLLLTAACAGPPDEEAAAPVVVEESDADARAPDPTDEPVATEPADGGGATTAPDPTDEPVATEPADDGGATTAPDPTAAPGAAGVSSAADLDDVTVGLEPVITLDAPIAAVVAPGSDDLWVAQRAGEVVAVSPDGEAGEVVVDLSAETTTDGERGLLGLAVHPDGTLLYTSSTDLDGATLVQEWEVDGAGVDPGSARTVLTVPQPQANHNGGGIAFGPDGMLHLGLGDGGGSGDPEQAGQDWGTPLGKMLRIDPTGGDPYAVPSGNPFADDPDGGVPEAWVRGVRNPWRFDFDPVTDRLWIADVGQDRIEEVTVLDPADAAGANLGWNLMEGDEPYEGGIEPDDHTPPVLTYPREGARCSITGGVVYRGDALPGLDGAYLYSDFCDGVIRAAAVDGDELLAADVELAASQDQVIGFARDADGEVLVLGIGGTVARLVPAG